MKVIILAAGIGSRLGKPYPKPLTQLVNGKTIMANQIEALLKYVDLHDIFIVVGFKKELIMEAFPDITFVYNNYFDTTNTSKSLLRGVQKIKNEDVLWLNGDVVFDHVILKRVIDANYSCMAVNNAAVGEEEVKYETESTGLITKVSKEVKHPEGEAVGINKILAKDMEVFKQKLMACKDNDYFEKAIELAIEDGLQIVPVNVSDVHCTEVDFEEDLKRANEQLRV